MSVYRGDDHRKNLLKDLESASNFEVSLSVKCISVHLSQYLTNLMHKIFVLQ